MTSFFKMLSTMLSTGAAPRGIVETAIVPRISISESPMPLEAAELIENRITLLSTHRAQAQTNRT